jgi:putative membrane protein
MKTLKNLAMCLAMSSTIAVLFFPAPASAQSKLTDPEIASIAVTANQVDINQAALAKKKSKNAEVLNFAQTMTNDHKAVIDQAVALVTKLKVTPKDNATSQKLLADAAKTKAALQTKSGTAFDKAYVDNEVAYHKAVIGVVEGTLIPATQNAELKALLQKVVPALKTHLEHAEMLQKSLNK